MKEFNEDFIKDTAQQFADSQQFEIDHKYDFKSVETGYVEGFKKALELVKNNGVLGDVSVLLPTDEEITDWVCDEFKIDGLNFDEDVETQYGYLPEYFKSFAKWIISNER